MMDNFIFTENDFLVIKDCIEKGHKSWSDDCIKNLKIRLKEFLKIKQNHVCCYCCRNIYGEFNLSLDIEHVLPKSKYPLYMFSLDNLAVSCKRCNMSIKGSKVDFIVNNLENNENPFDSKNYYFIHPNSDVYNDHIKFISHQYGNQKFVFYHIVKDSKKGKYSYEFFKLKQLVVNCFDKAQGIPMRDGEYNFDFTLEIEKLAKKNGQ